MSATRNRTTRTGMTMVSLEAIHEKTKTYTLTMNLD
jgi:hypothetical protein